MPRKLAVGAGIAQGAQAFMQSYQQAKLFKFQQKLQENAGIIEILTRQLARDDITYDEQAKILRSFPRLMGAKEETINPLLDGFEKANNELSQDENSPKTPAIPAQKGKAAEENGTQLFPREAVAEGAGGHTGEIRRGELSPQIIKKKLQIEYKKLESAGNIEEATKIFAANLQLQKELGTKGGYTIPMPATFDAEGNYIFNRMNSDGDTISKNMGKVTPEAIRKAEIMVDKPSSFVKEREDYWESQGLDPEAASKKALSDANDKFNSQQAVRSANATGGNLRNTGQSPIQPAQVADDTRANDAIIAGIRKEANDNFSVATAAMEAAKRLEPDLKAATKEKEEADREFYATKLKPGESGYAAIASRKERATDNYTRINDKYTEHISKETEARGKEAAAKGRLVELAKPPNSGTKKTYNEAGMGNFSPAAQKYIMTFFAGDVEAAQKAYLAKFGRELK